MRAVDLVGGTEIIPYEQCRELLAQEEIGRVAVVADGHVEIFPVNYGMDGDGIVFRTNPGRKMFGAITGEVAFEVDRIDLVNQTGWSVIVHGLGQDITRFDSPSLQGRAEESWTGPKEFLVRITPTSVTGRRVAKGAWS